MVGKTPNNLEPDSVSLHESQGILVDYLLAYISTSHLPLTMNYSTISILLSCLILVSCQKDQVMDPVTTAEYLPLHTLGDTLHNNSSTNYEEINVVIDSETQTGFKLISTHEFAPNQFESFFIRVVYDVEDKIRFLDSLSSGGITFSGPLLSTFEFGDTIKNDIRNEGVFDWFPETREQVNNSGWMKYQIFTATQGSEVLNFELGDNYLVFKFGDPSNERLGWMNLVYQDTLCYIKEGFYNSTVDSGITIGSM